MTEATNGKGARTLWIWVIIAFVVLVAAWAGLIVTAVSNQPEEVELQEP